MPPPAHSYLPDMAGYYPIKIEVEGRRYTGDWSLVMGGDVCVRSAWGSHRVAPGRRKPEIVAREALEAIVRAYHKARADERLLQEAEAIRLGGKRRRKLTT